MNTNLPANVNLKNSWPWSTDNKQRIDVYQLCGGIHLAAMTPNKGVYRNASSIILYMRLQSHTLRYD